MHGQSAHGFAGKASPFKGRKKKDKRRRVDQIKMRDILRVYSGMILLTMSGPVEGRIRFAWTQAQYASSSL